MEHNEEYGWWEGTVNLMGFHHIRMDVPGRQSKSTSIELRVEADDDGPMETQAAAYRYCLDNQSKIRDACLRGIVTTAKSMRPIFARAGWFSPERLEEILPKAPSAESLCTRVRLYDVCVTERVEKDMAYLEYSFNSAWDREHGLLIVLLRDQLVYSGFTGDGW
jgi:hypothetical protein